MSRRPKKRNKPYQGADAKQPAQGPNVQRYTAVVRSPAGEWWHENKRRVKIIGGVSGSVILIGWLIFELVRLTTGV